MNEIKKRKVFRCFLWVAFIVAYSAFLIVGFFRYREYVVERSDIYAHIYRALNVGGYSLNTMIYRLIDSVSTNFSFDRTTLCAVYNISLPALTVFMGAIFLKYFFVRLEGIKIPVIYALWLSFVGLFTCFIRIPGVFDYYYRNSANPNISSFATQPWHSDTYNLMRLFACGALILFFLIYQEILVNNSLSIKRIAVFTVFLLLANYAKPSLVVCFAPAALFFCLYDLIKKGISALSKYICVGVAFIVSLACIPYQYEYLFGEETQNGITLTMDRIMSGTLPEWVGVLFLSVAFPLAVIIIVIVFSDKASDLRYVYFGWVMYGVSLFLRLFFAETGKSLSSNNFAWSSMIAAYFLFMISVAKLYSISVQKRTKWVIIPWLIFGVHICCGIDYFRLILNGQPF